MKRKLAFLIGAAAVMAGSVTACETIEPGDYVVYRVAATQSTLSDGCYWSYQGNDRNVREDENTLRSSSTFIMYKGAEEDFFLDVGAMTLDGTMEGEADEGDVYEFGGKTVDVQWDSADGTGAKRTTTIKTGIDMTVDDSLVFGSVEITTTWACEGQDCGQIAPACTQTIEFTGIEVDDVDLEHIVAGGESTGSGMIPNGQSSSSGSSGEGGSSSGGSGGAGGSGTGGGETCSTCGDFAQDLVTYQDLCVDSQPLANDFATCACSNECYDACADNLCGLTSPSPECNSCAVSLCGETLDACYLDGSNG